MGTKQTTYIGKPCIKCGHTERFTKANRCVQCSNIWYTAYKLKNKERLAKAQKEFVQRNKEHLGEYYTSYYQENKEKWKGYAATAKAKKPKVEAQPKKTKPAPEPKEKLQRRTGREIINHIEVPPF